MRINERQLEQVDRQIKRILRSGNYYSRVYEQAGIRGVSSPEDFEKIPFTDKADLRHSGGSGRAGGADPFLFRHHRQAGDHSLYRQGCGGLGDHVCPVL